MKKHLAIILICCLYACNKKQGNKSIADACVISFTEKYTHHFGLPDLIYYNKACLNNWFFVASRVGNSYKGRLLIACTKEGIISYPFEVPLHDIAKYGTIDTPYHLYDCEKKSIIIQENGNKYSVADWGFGTSKYQLWNLGQKIDFACSTIPECNTPEWNMWMESLHKLRKGRECGNSWHKKKG